MLDLDRRIALAVAVAVAFLGSLGTALVDGHVTAGEWVSAGLTGLAVLTAVPGTRAARHRVAARRLTRPAKQPRRPPTP